MAGRLLTGPRQGGLVRRFLNLVGRVVNLFLGANAVIIGANLVWGFAFEFVLGPGHRQHHMALTVPLVVGAAGLGAGYLTAIRAENEARRLVWGVRAAILLEVGMAWLSFTDRHWLRLAVAVCLLGLLATAHQMARSYALGWIYDDNGERQKVTHRLRGRAFFQVTSFKERFQREVDVRDERRRSLIWMTLWLGGAAYLALRLHHATARLLFYAACGAGFFILLVWLPLVFKEILYQHGYQDMEGHKVLDAEPSLPGMQTVIDQKAHGNAGLATLGEALRLLRPGG